MLLLLHVRCCHISEMYLSFLCMLTMHLIHLHLLPQYKTCITKIVYMIYFKWLLNLGRFCPDIASLAFVLRRTPCRCGPRARPANRAASNCWKVSSAFLLSLQLHLPIFFLHVESGHVFHLKMYLTKPVVN